ADRSQPAIHVTFFGWASARLAVHDLLLLRPSYRTCRPSLHKPSTLIRMRRTGRPAERGHARSPQDWLGCRRPSPLCRHPCRSPVSDSHPVATYQERRAHFEAERLAIQKRWSFIANIRLAGFILLAVMVWWALREPAALKWFAALVLLV